MPQTILFTIQDAKGVISTTEMNVPDTVGPEQLLEFANAYAILLDPLIAGAITRIGIVQTVPVPGSVKASAEANSDVEEGARFQFRTENGFYTSMRLPTFRESFIIAGSNKVNTAATEVASYVTAMVTGLATPVAGGTVTPSDKRGEDIIALSNAVEQFVSSRS